MLSNQNKRPYDYLVVGAGLFGSVVAWRAIQAGKRVKVIDYRSQVGGNLYCEDCDGVAVTAMARISSTHQTVMCGSG